MEPTSVIDYDAEFSLPPEFFTDDDFLVEKENKGLFPFDLGHGFDSSLGFTADDEKNLVAGLTRKMVQSTLEDDFSGGFCGNNAFPVGFDAKAWGATGIGYGCRNQRCYENRQPRVSSRAAWDLYCAAAEEIGKMNIDDELYGYNNLSGRGHLNLPRKHSPATAAAKNPNNISGHYSHPSLPYQKLQAIQFQQLKQQQLMKHRRQLMQQSRGVRANNTNKNGGGPVDLSPSAWSNGSGMRPVFIGDHAGKRGSTGTGVFLPRRVNSTSPATTETRNKPTLAKVFVPARVAQVLNLKVDESVTSLNDGSWRQRSNNGGFSSEMKMEQAMKEPRLPTDWAY